MTALLEPLIRRRIFVAGIVQGVGFRPFAYRIATELGLAGFVGNEPAGVFIEVQGGAFVVDRFIERLVAEAPILAVIEQIEVSVVGPVHGGFDSSGGAVGFRIVGSRSGEGPSTLLPPDVATCDDCLAEVFDPGNRRFRHPFANCTNCGPRFTIIRSLPYDRYSTSMAEFALCDACAAEYSDPGDRRFHAEPTACPSCGPRISLRRAGEVVDGSDAVLGAVQEALHRGRQGAQRHGRGRCSTCSAGIST